MICECGFSEPHSFLFPDFCVILEDDSRNMTTFLNRIIRFYIDGFRSMTLGRTLWAIILIKLFIMFAVLRLFFFPDLLAGKSPRERAEHVLENLVPEK